MLPAWINRDAQPEILMALDPRFGEVAAYLEKVSRDADLATRFVVQGDELTVSA